MMLIFEPCNTAIVCPPPPPPRRTVQQSTKLLNEFFSGVAHSQLVLYHINMSVNNIVVLLLLVSEQNYQQKIPDLEKSLSLVKSLQEKQQKGGEDVITTTRYNLADNVYGKAEIDCSAGIVNLWLGANVMLEYTYEEAIEFLSKNESSARAEFETVKEDLMFVRDQIVTSEVSMSRIFNWDVRRKRAMDAAATANNKD
jgi:prefoldin subunit 5